MDFQSRLYAFGVDRSGGAAALNRPSAFFSDTARTSADSICKERGET